MGEVKRRRAHCAYCGAPKVSEDHVPPKNLFPTDRTNLITVPACYEHNGNRSGLDEEFRNYIATHVGNETPNTQELFQKTIRGVTRNKKLQRWWPDLSGFEVKIESASFRPMIEWITRGLYWHVYRGERIATNIQMHVGKLRNGEWLREFVSDMNRFRVGGDQFLCAYNRMDDYPTVSIWVYVFHCRIIAMAMTDTILSTELIDKYQAGGGLHSAVLSR
jgi:hypothetical protein